MVWLRNTDNMGNLAARLNGGDNVQNGSNNGSNDDLRHDFDEEVLDTSNESVHVDDEITISLRGKSPRSGGANVAGAKRANGSSHKASNGTPNGTTRRTPRGGLNGSPRRTPRGGLNGAASTNEDNGSSSNSVVRALNFLDSFESHENDKVTSSPKNKHLTPDRWKFKTRMKRKRDDMEDEEEDGAMSTEQSNEDSSQGKLMMLVIEVIGGGGGG